MCRILLFLLCFFVESATPFDIDVDSAYNAISKRNAPPCDDGIVFVRDGDAVYKRGDDDTAGFLLQHYDNSRNLRRLVRPPPLKRNEASSGEHVIRPSRFRVVTLFD
ncbi:hypothetical protein AAVH_18019 [Aphelenchoides avenae]|nr:hypothetical protein AAVH_18019 [Aphelenchus avenae]